MLRFRVPNILIIVCMHRLVGDVDEALRSLLPLFQRKVVVVGVMSLHEMERLVRHYQGQPRTE